MLSADTWVRTLRTVRTIGADIPPNVRTWHLYSLRWQLGRNTGGLAAPCPPGTADPRGVPCQVSCKGRGGALAPRKTTRVAWPRLLARCDALRFRNTQQELDWIMPQEIITKSELARRMAVDRSQPTRWEEQGMPTLPDGRVEAGAALAWVHRHVDPTNRNRRHARLDYQTRAQSERAEQLEKIDTMARLSLWLMAQQVPGMVAEVAVTHGLPVATARVLHDALLTRAAELADDTRGNWMGLPPSPELGPVRVITWPLPVDWPEMERLAVCRT